MAARHAEKCGGSKAPSFQRRSFNRAKDALLFKLLRNLREIDRLSCVSSQPSCLKRIYTLTCIIYLIYIKRCFHRFRFVQNGQSRVSSHFCIYDDVTRNKWTATVTLSSVSYYYIYQFSKKDLEAKFDTDFLFLTYSFLSFQLNKLKLLH